MNQSEQKLLKQFLEKLRKVYGKANFHEAYDIALKGDSWFLGIKSMINNKEFNSIAEKEINKAYRHAKSLNWR